MIERLAGVCAHRHPTGIIVDVNGVGYGVEMTPSAAARCTPGEDVIVWVYTHVAEGVLKLYGFPELADKQVFSALLDISGLGCSKAMAILSTYDAPRLLTIIEREEAEMLEEVPGIGAKSAKKWLLDLKPKFEKLVANGAITRATRPEQAAPLFAGAQTAAGAALSAEVLRDLASALGNFGYKDKELQPLLKRYERNPPAKALPELIRLALAELTGASKAAASAAAAEELF